MYAVCSTSHHRCWLLALSVDPCPLLRGDANAMGFSKCRGIILKIYQGAIESILFTHLNVASDF